MTIGAAFVAMKDLDTADKMEVATSELAGVLFEEDNEPDELEGTLAFMVELIRKHYSALAGGWAQERADTNRIAAAAREARDKGATLAVVAGLDMDEDVDEDEDEDER